MSLDALIYYLNLRNKWHWKFLAWQPKLLLRMWHAFEEVKNRRRKHKRNANEEQWAEVKSVKIPKIFILWFWFIIRFDNNQSSTTTPLTWSEKAKENILVYEHERSSRRVSRPRRILCSFRGVDTNEPWNINEDWEMIHNVKVSDWWSNKCQEKHSEIRKIGEQCEQLRTLCCRSCHSDLWFEEFVCDFYRPTLVQVLHVTFGTLHLAQSTTTSLFMLIA